MPETKSVQAGMEKAEESLKHRIYGTLRTQAFRIVLIYLFVFAVSATFLVGFTYWNTAHALGGQTDETINAEIVGLTEQYQRGGLSGLTDVIISRSMRGNLGLYLLADTKNRPLAGNLDEWPRTEVSDDGFVEFDYERHYQGHLVKRTARGRVFSLEDGTLKLLVARDINEQKLVRKLFSTTLPWSVGLMLLFGTIGGALISRNMLNRLDAINHTSRDIIAGDLTRRVPITGSGDEFDDLAENLNRMLVRIEQLMDGMRDVVDSVAHDLRTPLNRLRNRLEDVQHRLPEDSRECQDVEGAISETDRLISTFNAILLIAQADAGVTRETMKSLDLTAIAADMTEFYEPLAEEKAITITTELNDPATVHGNPSLVSQAMANLIDNAIKYTPEGGKIHVKVTNNEEFVALTVADNGPGIPAADRERVLQRFVRLEKSRNSPGTGLGLSLVDAVAHLHGAKFVLGDNEPGLRATIFYPPPKRAAEKLKPKGKRGLSLRRNRRAKPLPKPDGAKDTPPPEPPQNEV